MTSRTRIVDFDPAHLDGFVCCERQEAHQWLVAEGHVIDLAQETAIRGGKVIAIGGIFPVIDETSGWVLFSEHIDPVSFLVIFRHLKKSLEGQGPLFIHTDTDYPAGLSMAFHLGFRSDRMSTLPDGSRCLKMVRDAEYERAA